MQESAKERAPQHVQARSLVSTIEAQAASNACQTARLRCTGFQAHRVSRENRPVVTTVGSLTLRPPQFLNSFSMGGTCRSRWLFGLHPSRAATCTIPFSRSTSLHRRAQSSPFRRPVYAATTSRALIGPAASSSFETSCEERMVGDFRGVRSIVILKGSRGITSSSSASRSSQRRYRLSLLTASRLTRASRAAWKMRKSSAVRLPTALSPKWSRSRRITLSAVSTLAGFAVIRSLVRYVPASSSKLGPALRGFSARSCARTCSASATVRPAGLPIRRPFTRTSTAPYPVEQSPSVAPRRTPRRIDRLGV